jgi:CDK-activating kinase assembly factor MAT1
MVMNLVLKTDVKKTEAALNKYKEANADIIKANAALERNAAAAFERHQILQQEQANLRRQAAQLQDEDDRLQRSKKKKLATSSLAAGNRNMPAGASGASDDEMPVSDPSGLIKGLRRIRATAPQKAYDAFMGMATTRDYYELADDYPSIRLTKAKNDTRTKAGGFDFQAYFDESLLEAFAGLGCFIEEEHSGRREQAGSRDLATGVVAQPSLDKISDAVF